MSDQLQARAMPIVGQKQFVQQENKLFHEVVHIQIHSIVLFIMLQKLILLAGHVEVLDSMGI